MASFPSQLDDTGLLTGNTQSDQATKSARRGHRFGVGGQIAVVGGGNAAWGSAPEDAIVGLMSDLIFKCGTK